MMICKKFRDNEPLSLVEVQRLYVHALNVLERIATLREIALDELCRDKPFTTSRELGNVKNATYLNGGWNVELGYSKSSIHRITDQYLADILAELEVENIYDVDVHTSHRIKNLATTERWAEQELHRLQTQHDQEREAGEKV